MAGRNDFFKNETLMKIAAKHDKSVVQTKVKISNTCHFERSDQATCKAQPQQKIHLQRQHTFVILSFRTKRKTSIVILSELCERKIHRI